MIEPVLGKDVAELLEVEVAQPLAQFILSGLCMDDERVNDTWWAAVRSLGWSCDASIGWVTEGGTERFGESW